MFFTALLPLACARPFIPPSDPPPAVYFEGFVDEDGVDLLTLAPEVLFEEGIRAYGDGDLRGAARRFETIVHRFPEAPEWRPSLFNAGLVHQELERCDTAAERFAAYLAALGSAQAESRTAIEARFHRGDCLAQLERFEEAARAFDELLPLPLNPVEALSAKARGGVAHLRAGAHAEAELRLRAASALHRERDDLQAISTLSDAALAAFGLGELFAERAAAVSLAPPLDVLRQRLEEKAELFAEAQRHYFDAIQLRHRRWSTAAGFRLGALYERLHEDLRRTEPPPELDEDDDRVRYRKALYERLHPLVEKARIAYERTAEFAKAFGGEALEWAERSEERLRALERLLGH